MLKYYVKNSEVKNSLGKLLLKFLPLIPYNITLICAASTIKHRAVRMFKITRSMFMNIALYMAVILKLDSISYLFCSSLWNQKCSQNFSLTYVS